MSASIIPCGSPFSAHACLRAFCVLRFAFRVSRFVGVHAVFCARFAFRVSRLRFAFRVSSACAPTQLFQLSFVSCILKGCETRCLPTTTPVVALRAWLAPTRACPNPRES